MSFYSGYDKGSVGNILHFLYYVCGLQVAEHAMIDFQNKRIIYYGKPLALLSFDTEGFPVFDFVEAEDKARFEDQWHQVKRTEAIKNWKDNFNQRVLRESEKK
jgi:hypothetical protein